jgi:hypothetical protein
MVVVVSAKLLIFATAKSAVAVVSPVALSILRPLNPDATLPMINVDVLALGLAVKILFPAFVRLTAEAVIFTPFPFPSATVLKLTEDAIDDTVIVLKEGFAETVAPAGPVTP